MISELSVAQFGVTLYMHDIDTAPGETRRQAERRAVEELVQHVFGTEASYCHDAHGAPLVENVSACISVSHCSTHALLAVRDRGRVGVDIETQRQQLLKVAHKFMMPSETARYAVMAPDALLRLWTAKEAVFKAAATPSLTVSQIAVNLEAMLAQIPSGASFKLLFMSIGCDTVCVAVPK